MAQFIYKQFYACSLNYIIGYMILLIILWFIADFWLQKKLNKSFVWKLLNIITALGILGAIGITTLSSRSGSGSELILIPFHSFIEARIRPELYRSMLMNVFLFFPLGLSLPYALPEKWNRKVLLSILFAIILSIGIEFLQYHFYLGRAETDDVICNTLGCAIGSISYLLANRRKKILLMS